MASDRKKVNFEGGNLTSDSGLLLYRDFDEKLGLSRLIKETLQVNDSVYHHTHPNSDVIIQKIYQHVAGYHTDDHADELKKEPLFTSILGKERLALQPTISRLNQKFDKDTLKQLQKINQTFFDHVQKFQSSNYFLLDLDSANFEACGNQYGTSYNAHYQTNGYHPLFMFDGLTGDCIKAALRSGHVYTSRNVVQFVGPTLKHINKNYPWASIVIRCDSGFAVPALYELVEEHGAKYAIRLKTNRKLESKAQEIEDVLRDRLDIKPMKPYVFYRVRKYKNLSLFGWCFYFCLAPAPNDS
ncbi:IS1380 family transposase [Bacillus carboniphilus]|uniref:IS1380 family transposase n=1 Tax=Bacillus carboniphilus TaxID=86663 RepID=A0ABY9JY85_9BACI|nr:IS1380 family transposase [Bacillus carboniphilus]WLR44376.1 IS1380 family transposase [Bacillus carboniphilus]